MTTLDIIKKLKASSFESEDGEVYTLEFRPGLSAEELETLAQKFPSKHVPPQLVEILRETGGWDGYGLEQVYFDSIDEFGYSDLVPHSVTLGADGFGNYWVLEITSEGEAGKVYFVCHDPAVLVIHSTTLHQFIESLLEFYQNPTNNYLNDIHEDVALDIWTDTSKTIDLAVFRQQADADLASFLSQFDGDDWLVADLRHGKNKDGFAWGRSGAGQTIRKHPTEDVWVIQKKKKGFLSKLFGK